MMTGETIVIQFPGVNCEYETVRALESVGLRARIMRWNMPLDRLRNAAAIVVPGGFSYQDRLRAGVVAAKEPIMDAVLEAASRGLPVLGICNGAQILVEAGAVPGFEEGKIEVALAPNDMPDRTGYYCAWVRLTKGPARCLFTEFLGDADGESGTIPVPMAHAEGRFVTGSETVEDRLRRGDGVAMVYATPEGGSAEAFPANPNGALYAIAGLCNAAGNVLALMPHPERANWLCQVPQSIGGGWGKRRQEMTSGSLYAAGPGRGFFASLKAGLGQ
jgi:phosphoribosylformylglycinamidine synthase